MGNIAEGNGYQNTAYGNFAKETEIAKVQQITKMKNLEEALTIQVLFQKYLTLIFHV